MTDKTNIFREIADEGRAMLAVAQANWHGDSYSWHVVDWMAWKMRRKYPAFRMSDRILNDEVPF
jgi:hypothetical protein